jgi:hypothetical protein
MSRSTNTGPHLTGLMSQRGWGAHHPVSARLLTLRNYDRFDVTLVNTGLDQLELHQYTSSPDFNTVCPVRLPKHGQSSGIGGSGSEEAVTELRRAF